MKKIFFPIVVVMFSVSYVSADTFGTGENQFTIDFVSISGATNPTSGIPAGDGFFFKGVANDYRIGKFEITNAQWINFLTELAMPVTGDPHAAYDQDTVFLYTDVPVERISWYEAAQFVNWLNTSTGHQAAYRFTGTQGTSNYMLDIWDATTAYGGTNLYRHKDAFYFLPTETEWVKAAYWNGTDLQLYATQDDSMPIAGLDTNYNSLQHPWLVGNGHEELNRTYDMMGNIWEWMEDPWISGDYRADAYRSYRGGSFNTDVYSISSSIRYHHGPEFENYGITFRVASIIPEPASVVLISLGGLVLSYKKTQKKTT